MPDKDKVYSATGETTILPLEKLHLVAKNEFSFRPTWKDQQVGGNMLMWRQHETAWDWF